MLAEDDDEMVSFLKNHLIDVQNTGPNKMPWKFEGPWKLNGKHIAFKIENRISLRQISKNCNRWFLFLKIVRSR